MDGFVNSHRDLTVSADVRAVLRALAERLAAETPPRSILSCVQRVSHQVRPGQFEAFYTVLDPATRSEVWAFPVNKIPGDVFADWLLLQVGNTCASCLGFLIEGEEGFCLPCESREIMELMRLRDELG